MIGFTNAQIFLHGGILTVNAPAHTLVTISNGSKTMRKTANAAGVAIFSGMTGGRWTIAITSPTGVTSTRTVDISMDYEMTLAAPAPARAQEAPRPRATRRVRGRLRSTARERTRSSVRAGRRAQRIP